MMHLWYDEKIEDIYSFLHSSDNGLSSAEATKRIKVYGKNMIPKKKTESFVKIFMKELLEPLDILLLFAMLFSFLIGEYVDGFAILFIVLVDLLMGSIQEYKAKKTAQHLNDLITVKAKVIRDGEKMLIDASDVTIGDIIYLEPGDKICADMRLINVLNFSVNESILTGESINIYKDLKIYKPDTPLALRYNMVYAGTTVQSGRAKAIVTAISKQTEIGKLSDKINSTKEAKSPLTVRMEKFTKQICFFVVAIALVLITILSLQGMPFKSIILSVIALSVSAMPEGLALALTIALTVASSRMSKKKVIVKNLYAAESLGSCTAIATDKTGTLTLNEQTAKKIVFPNNQIFDIEGSGYNDEGIIKPYISDDVKLISKLGMINNEATLKKEKDGFVKYGDSIDIAFLVLGLKANVQHNSQIIDIEPYESEKKYSSVTFSEEGKTYVTIKGSVEVVLGVCQFMKVDGKSIPIDKKTIMSQNEMLAKEGYRIIAVAYKEDAKAYGDNYIFVGLVAFIDPIRKEVKETIYNCKKAGIKVLMITGDHPLTAYSIAKDLQIASSTDEVTSGLEIDRYLEKGEEEFDKFITSKTVFTRVTPLNKLEIVKSLKRRGEFVAVTGDGVNDAVAIKSANIGIAMGSGTDIAKDTSSLIILNDDFTSIVDGIKEGRIAYKNIRKVSYFLISCGLAEVLFFMGSILLNLPVPLIAIQLLWLNIVTDGLQDLALSFEKGEQDIMNEKPRNVKENLFNKQLLMEILISGVTIGLIVLLVWCYLIKIVHMDLPLARGYIMFLMVFLQNIHVLNCKSESNSVLNHSLMNNPFVLFSISSAIILQIIVSELPFLSNIFGIQRVPFMHMLLLLLFSFIILLVMEIYKYLKRRYTST